MPFVTGIGESLRPAGERVTLARRMKKTAKVDLDAPKPEAQLRAFLARFAPKQQKLFRAVRAAARKRFPTANELVYDYSHSVVIGYSPNRNGIDAVVAIAVREDGVALYVSHTLPDPKKLLLGTGKQTRFVRIESAKHIAHPDIVALLKAAPGHAKVPLSAEGKGALIVKSDATKRARRKKAK